MDFSCSALILSKTHPRPPQLILKAPDTRHDSLLENNGVFASHKKWPLMWNAFVVGISHYCMISIGCDILYGCLIHKERLTFFDILNAVYCCDIFSPHSNCTHTPCLTWHMIMTFMCTIPTRNIYLCHIMINAELLLARLIFFIQWFLNWKNSCQCLLFCSCFATRYMPLSAIKQLKNKHWIGKRKALVHQQSSSSFLTINI